MFSVVRITTATKAGMSGVHRRGSRQTSEQRKRLKRRLFLTTISYLIRPAMTTIIDSHRKTAGGQDAIVLEAVGALLRLRLDCRTMVRSLVTI